MMRDISIDNGNTWTTPQGSDQDKESHAFSWGRTKQQAIENALAREPMENVNGVWIPNR